MNPRAEGGLLLAARILVLILPVCLMGGRVAVDASMSLTAILFLVRSFKARDWQWLHNPWFKIAVGLWLWTVFISFFAFDRSLSFSQTVPWLRFLIFAAALETWVLNEVWMRRLLWVTTGVLVFTSFDALLQYVHGSDIFGHPRWSTERLTAMFDRPKVGIFLTKLMFPAVFGAFAWHSWRRGRLMPSLAFAGLVLLLMTAIFVSGERMALLLALLGLVMGAVLQKGPLRILVGGTLSLGLVGMLVLSLLNPLMIKRHVDETYDTVVHLADSPYGMIWNSGLHLAMQNPVLGTGMKNFRVACAGLDLPQSPEDRCGTHPHNLYLEWALGSGIPGLLGFLLLIGAWFHRMWQAASHYGFGVWLMGPLISMFIQLWPLGPTGSFFSNWAGGMFWLAVGWALAAVRLLEQESAPARHGESV
jgi:O-antigen ligase